MTRVAPFEVERATADCSVHAQCGGCPLMPATYAGQAASKSSGLRALFDSAGLALPDLSWVPAPDRVAYRNRLRLSVSPEGQPRFFNPHKSSECVALEPSVLDGMRELIGWARREPRGLAAFSHLELRGADALGRRGLRCVVRRDGPEARVAAPALAEDWLVAVIAGTPSLCSVVPCQRWKVAEGVYVEVPLDAFMQVNSAVNAQLVAHVVGGMVQRGVRSFADLFMGAGNFALPLLAAGLSGRGVEVHRGAVAAAREAARAQGLASEGFYASDTGLQVSAWLEQGRGMDAVLCDPPRAGLGASAPLVARLARRWLVLCSCQPETLCADIARILPEGFRVQSVSAFDMFPQTRHLEVVAWLQRST
jgi:23S rRNA (uracil1939-C5)-methyltransferase